MNERTIKGIVKSWGKEIKSPFKGMLKRTVHIEGDETSPQYGHGILNKDRSILEKIDNEATPGTEIEFIETENKGYWNFKFGSMKIGKKATPPPDYPPQIQSPSNRDESMNIYGNMEMAVKVLALSDCEKDTETLTREFLEITEQICDWKEKRMNPEKEENPDPTPKEEIVM